jgi:hypothetical protein
MVRKYFGSWDEALRRIGLDPEEVRLAKPTEHLTAKQLIARLKKRHNDPPRAKENSALPNAARKYFGSWTAALHVAGVEPRAEKSHWPTASKAAVVREIRRRKREGESLTVESVLSKKWGRALLDRTTKLFGSWTAARVAAGFDPAKNAPSPWAHANKAVILAEIRRRKRAGQSLATRKVERAQWGHPLINRAKKLFGSWGEAIRAAGLEPPPGMMSPWVKADKAAVAAELRRRARAHQTLLASQIEREKWGAPLVKRARQLFPSWKEALSAAGGLHAR